MNRKWRASWEKHQAEPVWYGSRTRIVCKRCRRDLLGDGTAGNSWRHHGEPVEQGVVA